MRKLIKFYVIGMFIMFITIIVFALSENDVGLLITSIIGVSISLVMTIPMGEKKWHLTYDAMEKDQKESIRLIRNANKLIDQTKRELFRQCIMTKDDVMKILDRTYEETLKDKK
jgi:hypothetical protein